MKIVGTTTRVAAAAAYCSSSSARFSAARTIAVVMVVSLLLLSQVAATASTTTTTSTSSNTVHLASRLDMQRSVPALDKDNELTVANGTNLSDDLAFLDGLSMLDNTGTSTTKSLAGVAVGGAARGTVNSANNVADAAHTANGVAGAAAQAGEANYYSSSAAASTTSTICAMTIAGTVLAVLTAVVVG